MVQYYFYTITGNLFLDFGLYAAIGLAYAELIAMMIPQKYKDGIKNAICRKKEVLRKK